MTPSPYRPVGAPACAGNSHLIEDLGARKPFCKRCGKEKGLSRWIRSSASYRKPKPQKRRK